MTKILVQRGSAGSSSSAGRSVQHPASQLLFTSREEEQDKEVHDESVVQDNRLLDKCECSEDRSSNADEFFAEKCQGLRNETRIDESTERGKSCHDELADSGTSVEDFRKLHVMDRSRPEDIEASGISSPEIVSGAYFPPPPPVHPPKPFGTDLGSRNTSGISISARIGYSRKPSGWPVISARMMPSGSHPSSPRSYGEADGYNSADEQSTSYGISYSDEGRERLFELEIRQVKGLEVKWMLEDGNCLFRAVADQVYGDSDLHNMARQMCIDYMERERDHFSQFITEGFTSYCKRKRQDKVYGNNVEIQAFSEMYNRPIHIYFYSTEPINIFHGNYTTDTPPIRLSYHHGKHYNSLVDPRRLTVGAGLGFSSLRGTIEKEIE